METRTKLQLKNICEYGRKKKPAFSLMVLHENVFLLQCVKKCYKTCTCF